MFWVQVCLLGCFVTTVYTENHLNDSKLNHVDLPSAFLEQLSSLKSMVSRQNAVIGSLLKTMEDQKIEINSMKQRIRDLEADHKALEPVSGQLQEASEDMTPFRGIRSISSGVHVAFSSFIDHKVNHIAVDNILLFNQVVINDGNAYNPVTGIFTCPVSGVYLFTYRISTDVSAYQLVAKLVVDGTNVSDGTSDPFHNLQEIQGGNTVIVRVRQMQAVWLAAYNTGDTEIDGRDGYRFSTFSGVLLYM